MQRLVARLFFAVGQLTGGALQTLDHQPRQPAGADDRLAVDTLGVVGALNRARLAADGDPEIATRIASYEMAHRLQTSAPELMDLSQETAETLALYGCTPAEAEAKFLEKTALRRLATPEEIATHDAFLASSMAAHLTGTSLTIDGGSTKSP